jgi:hypothetical protein
MMPLRVGSLFSGIGGLDLDDARRRARELGVARVRGFHRWTTRDERTLMRMAEQGATWGEIARAIGCTAEAARSREWAVRRRREEVA